MLAVGLVLWENVVGRGRPFWDSFYPFLQDTFPDQLGRVNFETFFRAINKVQRSLIRTDADEVTYNLHIMLRFDLELELLEGRLRVKDLPDAWRARMQADLGIAPMDDHDGSVSKMCTGMVPALSAMRVDPSEKRHG
jgi:carboxypeptidase Taq